MQANEEKPLRIAFVINAFPLISETFIINQVADLLEAGLDVTIFSGGTGDRSNVSERYFQHRMWTRTVYLDGNATRFVRFLHIWPLLLRLLTCAPHAFAKLFRFRLEIGRLPLIRQLLKLAPFIGRPADVVHCHMGAAALRYFDVRDTARRHALSTHFETPVIVTFYGYDVSAFPAMAGGSDPYINVKRGAAKFLVMSQDMRERVIALGFDAKRVVVLPVSIDVDSMPFCDRRLEPGNPVELVAVGRFVEKKGFDDLIRAMAIVRKRSAVPVNCTIVGGGTLKPELDAMRDELDLSKSINFPGYMKVEDVVKVLLKSHVLISPSKTASDGDME